MNVNTSTTTFTISVVEGTMTTVTTIPDDIVVMAVTLGSLGLIAIMVVISGWYYARSYPVGEKHESQSESDTEPIDGPVGP